MWLRGLPRPISRAMLIRPLDFAIFIPALGAVAAAFVAVYAGAGNQYTIHLRGENGEWVFPEDAVETVHVAGPLGDTLVAIQNGEARVLASPCANQTCVAAGAVYAYGQWAACLPNRVMLYVSGSAAPVGGKDRHETGVDAVVW